jgi:hypothetical protein
MRLFPFRNSMREEQASAGVCWSTSGTQFTKEICTLEKRRKLIHLE